MKKMVTKLMNLTALINDPNNARTHSVKNLESIKGSLAKFGQQKPIVINQDNIVIAGNGTLQAARALGWEKINVTQTSLDKFDQTAFAIADNRTSELAEWDDATLAESLQSLIDIDFNLEDIGFYEPDLIRFNLNDGDEAGIEDSLEDGSKELDPDDFSDFEHTCPKCSFEFNGKK